MNDRSRKISCIPTGPVPIWELKSTNFNFGGNINNTSCYPRWLFFTTGMINGTMLECQKSGLSDCRRMISHKRTPNFDYLRSYMYEWHNLSQKMLMVNSNDGPLSYFKFWLKIFGISTKYFLCIWRKKGYFSRIILVLFSSYPQTCPYRSRFVLNGEHDVADIKLTSVNMKTIECH